MELHYRRFRDLRSKPGKKKANIEPYDSAQLVERFKKEFLQNIKKLESEIQAVLDENQAIIDRNRAEQDIIDSRKMRLEDRMIALLSFNTVILLYGRFLDSRQADAKGHLSDPLDDLESLEAQVVNDERLIEQLQKQLDANDTDNLEEAVTREQNRIEEFSAQQKIRMMNLKLRKLEVTRALKAMPKEPDFRPKRKYHINHSELPIDETDYDSVKKNIDLINFTKLIQEEAQLRKLHADIAEMEEKYNRFFQEHNKIWHKKADRLVELAESFHEISNLRTQIDEMSLELAKMKFQRAKMNDAAADMRREEAYIECLRNANERRQNEIAQAQEKIDEMTIILKKRKRHANKRNRNMDNLVKEIQEATEEKNEYENKVISIENNVFSVQMKLNLKLKECQTLMNYVPPPELFNEKGKRNPRLEEISKVLEIVSIDKTENQ